MELQGTSLSSAMQDPRGLGNNKLFACLPFFVEKQGWTSH